jgi:hypothetical protein
MPFADLMIYPISPSNTIPHTYPMLDADPEVRTYKSKYVNLYIHIYDWMFVHICKSTCLYSISMYSYVLYILYRSRTQCWMQILRYVRGYLYIYIYMYLYVHPHVYTYFFIYIFIFSMFTISHTYPMLDADPEVRTYIYIYKNVCIYPHFYI